ncbi:D-tyrosyl-tRNA(Tyr) deacylase [Candidatus Methanoplasma termitum]|uniref:D-aminoacyl-tRNA deacylase n=1 Tax=Candidatus Methanoplasma termitum TaxID=1577791 RepID=A0A0A7LCK4_9ARCH|nr:D-aminoacyl-tRNA deacylase [Candidatus Methanoplasma termitum]AIZ56799.1 D-tyrosyl-tRNA(Tyr) deacylase [Candidatus Methanoplasma termitum]MCL2333885.1 D-aminoacyl-tRNA deacylase [Candidatus Methanoplasma sp.]
MTERMRLLVCCETDIPSVNMKSQLIRKRDWEDIGMHGNDSFLINGRTVMMTTPDLHIRLEDLDNRIDNANLTIDEVVFMSRHSATSGEAALTVHPIGNFHKNEFGGREKTLVRANPALMTDALRRIAGYNDLESFKVCFEVTHHGPWLKRPTFFIEIGSDGRNWGNERAADILTDVLLDMEPRDYCTAVGVGGGHYAPRFTEVALEYKINFGHMLPNYQIEGSDDEDTVRMVKDACSASDTKLVYIHRKSMKGPEERRISELIRSAGFELITSSNLEHINGN